MNVLMIGCDKSTKGGMWKVVENYLESDKFMSFTNLKYIPTSITGKFWHKINFTFNAYLKIIKYIFKNKPNILHVHMSERGSVFRKGLIIYLAHFLGIKIIIHMHGAEFEVWYRSQNVFVKRMIIRILNHADKVIILGRYWFDFISTLVPKDKIFILHNAVYVPSENEYNVEAKDILFLGVVGKRKGAYDLLEAFKNSLDKIPSDVNLIYYGPDFENRIVDDIKLKKLSDRVKYMGWLSDEDKKNVFKNTMINILPSYNEGLPMTILETMAYGIPNISTNIAAIPEVISKNNGIIVTPGQIDDITSAIVNLVISNKIRLEKSKNAYLTVKSDFSVDIHIEKLIGLYRDVLKGEY